MNAVLRVDGIVKHFGAVRAVDGLSFEAQAGKITGLLGRNGAGKTTTLRMITGVFLPDSGAITLFERPGEVFRDRIGYLPEERGLYRKMQVREQLSFLGETKGLRRARAMELSKQWLARLGLSDWATKRVEDLSKGMQQKVQFIVTVIHQPRLLIFDEPFSGFDPINVNLLKEEILTLKETGSTIIFSTHNMASVEELCDHIALIDNARKILDGNVKAIRDQYATNTFEVRFNTYDNDLRAILPGSFEILESRTDAALQAVRIKLPREAKPNDLLSILMPHVTIHSLNEIIPGMNDIFIKVVTDKEVST
jgi:ABC-2 type transport system ATP-binding protein